MDITPLRSQSESQPPRKRPKTQGEMRIEVQELHMEVLKLEKEKMEIEKENLLIHRKKLELQVELLQRKVGDKDQSNKDHFECPYSPNF